MTEEAATKILTIIMEKYLAMDYNLLPDVLGYEIKQEVGRLNNIIFKIYSNDHPPAHFHVTNKEGSLDAKFSIKDCSLLEGHVSSKDMRRIQNWYKDDKVSMLLETWKKNKIYP